MYIYNSFYLDAYFAVCNVECTSLCFLMSALKCIDLDSYTRGSSCCCFYFVVLLIIVVLSFY